MSGSLRPFLEMGGIRSFGRASILCLVIALCASGGGPGAGAQEPQEAFPGVSRLTPGEVGTAWFQEDFGGLFAIEDITVTPPPERRDQESPTVLGPGWHEPGAYPVDCGNTQDPPDAVALTHGLADRPPEIGERGRITTIITSVRRKDRDGKAIGPSFVGPTEDGKGCEVDSMADCPSPMLGPTAHLLLGSLQQAGGWSRVNARLVDPYTSVVTRAARGDARGSSTEALERALSDALNGLTFPWTCGGLQ